MRAEDMILVSVDDHVVEPPDLFEGRVPAKFVDQAPKVVHKEDGTDYWVYEGSQIPNIGLNAVAGRPPEEYGMEPTSYSEMRKGCYDIHERIRDMNANGVLGQCASRRSRSSAVSSGHAPRTRSSALRCSRRTTTGT